MPAERMPSRSCVVNWRELPHLDVAGASEPRGHFLQNEPNGRNRNDFNERDPHIRPAASDPKRRDILAEPTQ